jgi:hypothetical protein
VDRGLRERCQAKLKGLGLDLPVPFTIEAFCEALAAHLGRQIVLCPVDTRTGPSGLWVATATTDYFPTSGIRSLSTSVRHVSREIAEAPPLGRGAC